MSEYIAIKLRNSVRKRAAEHCEYCRIPENFSPQPFCFEHILPKVSGGKTLLENLALACQGCNAFKATRTEFEDELSGERSNSLIRQNQNGVIISPGTKISHKSSASRRRDVQLSKP